MCANTCNSGLFYMHVYHFWYLHQQYFCRKSFMSKNEVFSWLLNVWWATDACSHSLGRSMIRLECGLGTTKSNSLGMWVWIG